MSGFQSQAGHVGFRTQSAKGVFANPTTNGVFMRIRDGGLGGNRELMIPDPEIGGNRDVPDALLGPVAFAGEYNYYARMESLATLLRGAFGTSSSATSGSGPTLVGTHTITPIEGADLPWLSIEEKIGDGLDAFRYTDARVNTVHLEADAAGYLMGTSGLIALTQVAIGAASANPAPDFDTTELMVGSNITVAFDSVDLRAKSFNFDFNNNMEDDDFRLGSLFLGDAVPKRRECTLGVTLRPETRDLWRQAVYGDPNATQAQGTVVKSDVLVTCESYAVIGSSASLYTLELEIPVAAIEPFDFTPSGDDIIQYDATIRCLRPDPNDLLVTATVKNGLATVL